MTEFGKYIRDLAENNPTQLKEALLQLSEREAESILYDWEGIWARPNQIIDDDWPESTIIFCAGRGFGKSRLVSEYLRKKAKNPSNNFALVGATNRDVIDVMVLGDSGVINVCPDNEKPEYEPSKARLVFPNGVICNIMSAETPDRARGGNRSHIIADELGSWPDIDMYHQLMLSLRKGESKFIGATTPRPSELMVHLFQNAVFNNDPPQEGKYVRIIGGSTYENIHNLSKTFRDTVISTYENTRLGSQELEGKLLLDSEGALWSTQLILDQTLKQGEECPPLEKVVIGVDPAVTTGKHSDKTGIVVAGLGDDENAYVLGDYTDKYTPQGWVKKVHSLYEYYRNMGIPVSVAVERNQGGTLIKESLTRDMPFLPVTEIFSSKSKIARAEPIAMLYEQGKVYHIKTFPDLEQEMCGYEGKSRQKSPDRMDAMVFALTELMPSKKSVTKSFSLFV